MPKALIERIISVEQLAPDIFRIRVYSEYVAAEAKPGQFINIRCSDGLEPLVRRPISICDVDREAKSFDIVFQVRGKGTKLLSVKKAGELLDFTGPLGSSFLTDKKPEKVAVVGGGIGVFPLPFALRECGASVKNAYLGFRSRDYVVLENEFKSISNLCITTDDGSYAECGLVTGPLKGGVELEKPDVIYACGPGPMLKSVINIAEENVIDCRVSLEETMGCGIGACLVCVCRTKQGDDFNYSRVCREGPVFDIKELYQEGDNNA